MYTFEMWSVNLKLYVLSEFKYPVAYIILLTNYFQVADYFKKSNFSQNSRSFNWFMGHFGDKW